METKPFQKVVDIVLEEWRVAALPWHQRVIYRVRKRLGRI